MQKLRTALVSGVVVVGVLGAAGSFYLVQQTSPEAARSLLAVMAGMIVALGVCVWVLLGPTLKRIDDLVEALRALARGEKHTRVDAVEFAGLADVARAVNEVAAALCENDDPNLGPVLKKTRERPTEIHKVPKPSKPQAEASAAVVDVDAVSSHPEIGAVRVRKKRDGRGEKAESKTVEAKPSEAKPSEPQPEPSEARSAAPVEVKPAESKTAEPKAADVVDVKPAPSTVEAPSTPARRADDDTVIEPAEPRLPGRAELQSLFAEFVQEKKAAHHDDVDVDFDAFSDTILAECERLVQEHSCRGVRFEVAVADGEVSLRPRLLR